MKMTLFKALFAVACLAFAVSATACPKSSKHDDCTDAECQKIVKVDMPVHTAAEDNCAHGAGECEDCQHCKDGGPCADDCASCSKASKVDAMSKLIAGAKTEHKTCSKAKDHAAHAKAHAKGECTKC